MAHSSRTKSSISIDLFNCHHCWIQEDNPQCSAKYQTTFSNQMARLHTQQDCQHLDFDRLTPNGNEGVGVQIDYLSMHTGPDTMSLTSKWSNQCYP